MDEPTFDHIVDTNYDLAKTSGKEHVKNVSFIKLWCFTNSNAYTDLHTFIISHVLMSVRLTSSLTRQTEDIHLANVFPSPIPVHPLAGTTGFSPLKVTITHPGAKISNTTGEDRILEHMQQRVTEKPLRITHIVNKPLPLN